MRTEGIRTGYIKPLPRESLMTRIGKLALCIAAVLFFIFFLGPWMENIPLIKNHVQLVNEQNIDASALYYTEIEQFADAEMNIENTIDYMPKGPVKKKK